MNKLCFEIGTALSANRTRSTENFSDNSTALALTIAMNSFLQVYSFVQTEGRYNACYLQPPYNRTSNNVFFGYFLLRNLYAKGIPYGCFKYENTAAMCLCKDDYFIANVTQPTMREGCRMTDKICQCPHPLYDFKDETYSPINFFPNAVPHVTAAIFIFFFTIPAALSTSILAIVVWAKNRHLQTVTNIFVINLIVANATVALLRLPVRSLDTFMIRPRPWIIEEPLWLVEASCRIYSMLGELCMLSTVYLLALIGYERYQAICHPLESQRQLSRGRARKLVTGVWLWCAVLSIPAGYANGVILSPEMYAYRPACDTLLNDAYATAETVTNYKLITDGYQIFLSCGHFLLPSGVLLTVYGKILVTLYRRNRNVARINEEANTLQRPETPSNRVSYRQQFQSFRRSRKATLMCCSCLAAFIILWTPFEICNIMIAFYHFCENPKDRLKPMCSLITDNEFTSASKILLYEAIANLFTFLNPAIYCFTNQQWLTSAKKILSRCLPNNRRVVTDISMNDVMREKSSSSTVCNENVSQMKQDSVVSGSVSVMDEIVVPRPSTENDAFASSGSNMTESERNSDVLTYRRRSP